MPTKILIATPEPAFGEWLQASLLENGYDAHLVHTGSEVLPSAAENTFAVAILDADLPGEAFVPLARALVSQIPGLRLLVIPPENNPQHPNLAGLVPQGYLFRPFYLPGLLDTLQSLLSANGSRTNGIEAPPVEVDSPVLTWLEDPGQAGRELARLLLETSAQTALIAAEGRLWASAGQTSLAAAQEAAVLLANCWQGDHPVDLARYVRLEAVGSENLLYAAPLLDELALALLFPQSTPLTRAHRETARVARALTAAAAARPLPDRPAAPVPEPELETEAPVFPDAALLSGWLPAGMEELQTQEDEILLPASSDENQAPPETETSPPAVEWSSDDLRSALSSPNLPPMEETSWAGEEDEDDDSYPDEEPAIDLASVLAGMPSPDPGGEPVFPAADWIPEQETSITDESADDEAVSARLDALSAAAPSIEEEEPETGEAVSARLDALSAAQFIDEQPASDRAPEIPVTTPQPAPPPAETPEIFIPPVTGSEPSPGKPAPAPSAPDIPAWLMQPPASETRPLPVEPKISTGGKTGPVEVRAPRDPVQQVTDEVSGPAARAKTPRARPVTAGTDYTCILIPERPDHYLTGDLADRLSIWVPQLCLAFGWRLSGLVVRPGYLQWTVELDPNVSPGNVVRILRQRTGERVFSQFPHLRYGLARDDFWAPGYLAVRGSRPPAPTLLDGFIRQTRARQRY